ncbi:hypothetical protein [Weissella kandleri]|uniref:hypothetical protein n=1 Tax=Weissella kandleri TaxID=1616 RepID=UPI00070BB5D7|nr:hypothetical protein [Weissella kandleri]
MGCEGKNNDKEIIYNLESIEALMTLPNITEATAKLYIELYTDAPFQEVNWKIKRQLDEVAKKHSEFVLYDNKIYKIVDNHGPDYKTGVLRCLMKGLLKYLECFRTMSLRLGRRFWLFGTQNINFGNTERDDIIAIKKSNYVLEDAALNDFGVFTNFMDGWHRYFARI